MPIGNGDIGLNVWVEPSGDLVFFIGKTDAWDENMRLLKLTKLRLKFDPPLMTTDGFRQELKLLDGVIEIQDRKSLIRIWVDANHPVIQVDAKSLSGQPMAATATLEPWRKDKRAFADREYPAGFASIPAFSYPDTILPRTPKQIGWYHHNMVSPWGPSLKLQNLEAITRTGKDPILNRTMGGVLLGDDFVPVSDLEMTASKPAGEMSLRIHLLTQITDTPEQWLAALEEQAGAVENLPAANRWREHCRWWNEFWSRSWIFADGNCALAMPVNHHPYGKLLKEDGSNSTAETATRGYVLQRWMNGCGGRGAFPIKFNGSIFVVDNAFDADYRQWGGGYWFQNTRLPYWSMLAAGDFDLMRPLFDMYMKALAARKLATKTYYGHAGAFFPETMSFWGNYLDQGGIGYGEQRAGKPDGLTDNQYIRRYWQGGLELVAMMLDYHDFTQDVKFRDTTLVPFATEVIAFFDQHWQRGPDGKILFHPAQALETWWDCTNPTPEIAGLRCVIPRLRKLTHNVALNAAWQKTFDDLPPVPLSADAPKRILPAQQFASKNNLENPELYAVFPYRLYGVGNPDLDTARNTFAARQNRQNGGWQQDSIQAALLGLTEEACRCVVDSASRHASDFRFPAMWGPNYDWTPDQDHGSVMMNAFQRMLVQYDGEKILLLPAWPKEWNVRFKLRVPHNTTVEGMVKDGKLTELRTTPDFRKKDVVIMSAQ
jgi:hypothetical protein